MFYVIIYNHISATLRSAITAAMSPSSKQRPASVGKFVAMLNKAQMQDLVVAEHAAGFIGNRVAVMVLDILYGNGTLKPLTEEEKIAANLLVFSDILPKV